MLGCPRQEAPSQTARQPSNSLGVTPYRTFGLTKQRAVEEAQSGNTPGAATSIFKYCGANLGKRNSELQVAMMGTSAGDIEAYSAEAEAEMQRAWLAGKASSIAGGSNEVQLNIIAKRVLGLPD